MKKVFIVFIIIVAVLGFLYVKKEGIFKEELPKNKIELQGNIDIREVRPGFRVAGRISKLFVDEGDRVKKGMLLAKLDSDYYKLAVKEAKTAVDIQKEILLKLKNGSRTEEIVLAKANVDALKVALNNAKRNYLRAKRLYKKDALAEQKYDDIETIYNKLKSQLDAANAKYKLIKEGPRIEDIKNAELALKKAKLNLQNANKRLDDCKLESSSNGIIESRLKEAGDFVNTGFPIFTISLSNPVWVRAYINEELLGLIKKGMKAIVKTDSNTSYKAKIGFISPVAEFTPKTVETKKNRTDLVYRIRVIVDNPDGRLKQGMPVTVVINIGK
jgi:HlyD family secretion protein